MLAKIASILAVIACLATAGPACGMVTFVDTIGSGSLYQIGGELTRTVQVGFDTHPASGNFTGVRPTYKPGGVHDIGTSGVPCAEKWVLTSGSPCPSYGPVYGEFAAWVKQKFYAKSTGYLTMLKFIGQAKPSLADATPPACPPSRPTWRRIWVHLGPCSGTIEAAHSVACWGWQRGTLVTVLFPTPVYVTAGTCYSVWIGVGTPGSPWPHTGQNHYVNLNWAWKSVVPDASSVLDLELNNDNGNGTWVSAPSRVLGIAALGYSTAPTSATPGIAKELADGEPVDLTDVVINGNTGAIGTGFFYVEDPLRPSGIRVIGSSSCAEGERVRVVGTLTTLASGERAIQMDALSTEGEVDPVGPMFANMRASKSGLEMTGLLVRIAGKIQSVADGSFVLNDGSDADGIRCVGVSGWSSLPTAADIGEMRTVTGVVSVEAGGTPVILIRKSTDILP